MAGKHGMDEACAVALPEPATLNLPATPEQRDAIERATVELRKARAAGSVGLTLRMGDADGAIVVPAPGHQPIAELRVVVNDVTGELHRDMS